MNQQTRRQFFKTVAATAAGVVAVGMTPKVVQGDDRSVVWNVAGWDMLGVEPLLYCSPFVNKRKPYMFHVIATEPIKEGQALVWNPDGTVRGI